jgi:predicted RNA-binding protein YlxR (DUF448 family)
LSFLYSSRAGEIDLSLLARNPYTPIEILERLAASEDRGIRSCVAQNKSTPSVILNKLVTLEEDEYVVRYAIGNPATDPEAIASYVRPVLLFLDSFRLNNPGFINVDAGRFYWILDSSSRRNDVPSSDLTLIYNNEMADRKSLAMNSRLPSSDLLRLSKDQDHDVVQSIADNPKVQGAADALSGRLSSSGFSKPGNK